MNEPAFGPAMIPGTVVDSYRRFAVVRHREMRNRHVLEGAYDGHAFHGT